MQDRVHADPVVVGVELRRDRLGVLAQRAVRVRVQRDADRHSRRQRGPERLERQPVAEEDVMRRRRGQAHVAMARSVCAHPVALVHGLLGLVDGGPHAHPVTQRFGEHAGVLREQLGRVTAGPPALLLQRLGQLPVVHGGHRDDAVGAQLVDQRAVVVQPRLVDRTAATGQHPRPGDREAVGAHAQLGQAGHVLGHPVVGVAGDVTRLPAAHVPRRVTEYVPDRASASVLVDGSLDLVGGGPRTPEEALREAARPRSAVRCQPVHLSLLVMVSAVRPVAAAPPPRDLTAGGRGCAERRGVRRWVGGAGSPPRWSGRWGSRTHTGCPEWANR